MYLPKKCSPTLLVFQIAFRVGVKASPSGRMGNFAGRVFYQVVGIWGVILTIRRDEQNVQKVASDSCVGKNYPGVL